MLPALSVCHVGGARGERSGPRSRPPIERAVAELIRALGLDRARGARAGGDPRARRRRCTPRSSRASTEENDPDLAVFPHESQRDELVMVRDLEFHSLCIHHFVPFFGRAHDRLSARRALIGISGPARLLDHYARRPQLQERIGQQVADHLERLVKPRGVAVMLEARHLCMEMRGIRKPRPVETRVVRGALAEPRWAAALERPRRRT